MHPIKPKKIKTLVLATVAFWLPLIIFIGLATEITERKPIFLDNAVLTWIHTHATGTLDRFFETFTTLGNVEILLPIALLIMGLLWFRRYRSGAVTVFFGFFGAAAATIVLKLLFHRHRPTLWHALITENGFSFPSGHALMTSALAFSVIAILWRTRYRSPSLIIGGLFVLLIGYSRLYLGVHYPSDVLAGWSISLAWIVTVDAIVRGRLKIPYVSDRLNGLD